MQFTKLFSSITESTIWCEPSDTRIVWITMLAMADRKGQVFGSVPGLANRAQVPLQATRNALQSFLSPDVDSRTPDKEGRRIEPIDGGWLLLNHAKYRAVRDEEERKAYKTEKQREYRGPVECVDKGGHEYTSVDAGNLAETPVAFGGHNAEAYSDAEADTINTSPNPKGEPPGFIEFWKAYPKKVEKSYTRKCFVKARCNANLPAILAAIAQQKQSDGWTKQNGQFIPNPATWINRGRWDDESGGVAQPQSTRGYIP